MKTIRCTFGSALNGRTYSFNIDRDDIEVGDILISNMYKQPLTVMKIEDQVYENFDYKTGRLGEGAGVIKMLPADTKVMLPEDEEDTIF